MRLFGRKANQQSTNSEVPPELKQYYEQGTRGKRLRRAGLFVLPVLAAALLIAALIGGAVWLQHHRLSDLTSRFSSSQASKPQTKQPTSPSPSSSTPAQPSPSSSQAQLPGDESSNGTSSSSNPSNSGSASTPNGAANSQTASGTLATIPDTGPDSSVVILSVVAAVSGAALFHIRQIRHAKDAA